MTRINKSRLVATLLMVLVVVGSTFSVSTAHAEGTAAKADVEATVGADGVVTVTETFTFDGGAPSRIEQRLVTDKLMTGDREYRYQITETSVQADGRDVSADVTHSDGVLTITARPQGAKKVTVSYTVRGAAAQDSGNLTVVSWPVVQGLSFGVNDVQGKVSVPAHFQFFRCTAGAPDSDAPCRAFSGATHDVPEPIFTHGAIGPNGKVAIEFGFDPAAVAANADVHEFWTLQRAFSVRLIPLVGATAILLLGAALLYFLHRKAGSDASAQGAVTPIAEFRPVGEGVTEFVVLGDVRPGLVGTVADERVDPVDITASLIDLAVRGHLRIEELPTTTGRSHAPTDWNLVRRDNPDEDLPEYEAKLLDIVAPVGAEPTRVSQLGEVMGGQIGDIQSLMYDEIVRKGWYERRPDDTRNRWNRFGVVAVVVGAVLTAGLAAWTSFGLVGVAVLLVGLGLLFVAQEMPARTGAGAALLSGMGKLRGDLLTSPTNQMPEGRRYHELSEVLPYAVVLGGTERWLNALVDADTDDTPDSTDLDWYHGPADWHMRDLPDSLRNFVTTVSGVLFTR